MNEPSASNILVVAAEASSELYARRIIEESRRRGMNLSFFGIGSENMAGLGFDLVEKSENMAVVGLWEVMAHWKVISRAFKNILNRAKSQRPRVALLLDYPDFNLRLARKLHALGVPVVYFISPQVWAWRTGRVHLIKKIISRMLVVFPFETSFYEKFGVPVRFVGHPLLDEIGSAYLTPDARRRGRQQMGVREDEFLVGLLPGSRDSELKYNLQSQLEAAALLAKERAQTRFLLLVAPSLSVEKVKALLPPGYPVAIRLVQEDPLKVMQLCDACLVASGTATLMTGLACTPMVIMYRMNPMTGVLARRLVKTDFFGMANLILGEKVVPELFQDDANPRRMADELMKFVDDPAYRSGVKERLAHIKNRLGNGGAISRVVDNLQELLAGGAV